MSLHVKEIHFATDAEGWSPTAGDGQIWQAWYPQHKRKRGVTPNPSHPRNSPPLSTMGGCLRTTVKRNAPQTSNYWERTCTWEDLGITPGATVTSVQGDYLWRVVLYGKKHDRDSDATWTASGGGGSGVFSISGSGDGADQDYDYNGTINGRDAYIGLSDSHYTVDFNGSEYEVLNGANLWYDGQSGSSPANPWEETSWKQVNGHGDITLTPNGSNPLGSGPFELHQGCGGLIDTFSAIDYAPARSSGGDLAYPLSGGDNSVSFTMAAWRHVVGTNVSVPGGYQPSNSSIRLRLRCALPATEDAQQKWIRFKQDYVKLTMTYMSTDTTKFFFMG